MKPFLSVALAAMFALTLGVKADAQCVGRCEVGLVPPVVVMAVVVDVGRAAPLRRIASARPLRRVASWRPLRRVAQARPVRRLLFRRCR